MSIQKDERSNYLKCTQTISVSVCFAKIFDQTLWDDLVLAIHGFHIAKTRQYMYMYVHLLCVRLWRSTYSGGDFFNLVRSCSSEKRRWRKITKLNASEWARSSKCCLLQNQLTGFQFRYGCWRNSMLKPDMVPMKYIIVLDNGFPSDPEVGHVAC